MFQNYSPQTKLNMSSAHTVIAQTLCSSLVNNVITWKLLNMTLLYSTLLPNVQDPGQLHGKPDALVQSEVDGRGGGCPWIRVWGEFCFKIPPLVVNRLVKQKTKLTWRCCQRTSCIQSLPLVSPNTPPCPALPSSSARWAELESKSWLWAPLCRGAFRYFHPIHPSSPPYIAFSSK